MVGQPEKDFLKAMFLNIEHSLNLTLQLDLNSKSDIKVLFLELLLGLLHCHFTAAQGPNTLTQYNPNLRTMSANGSMFACGVFWL
jgi:hypothetical protein